MVEFSMFFSFELQKIPDMWRCLSIIACPQWSIRSLFSQCSLSGQVAHQKKRRASFVRKEDEMEMEQ